MDDPNKQLTKEINRGPRGERCQSAQNSQEFGREKQKHGGKTQ